MNASEIVRGALPCTGSGIDERIDAELAPEVPGTELWCEMLTPAEVS